jgi:hypothetical protein
MFGLRVDRLGRLSRLKRKRVTPVWYRLKVVITNKKKLETNHA